MSEDVTCPFCDTQVPQTTHPLRHRVVHREDHTCGPYYIAREEEAMFLHNTAVRAQWHTERLRALLKERHLRGDLVPLLVFGDDAPSDFEEGVVVQPSDLLRSWPRTVPERIERSFCCLAYAAGEGTRAGRRLEFNQDNWREFLPFALDVEELIYFVKALEQPEYGWIRTTGHYKAEITPAGWARFHELTQAGADRRNPVFVAMWFGKPGQGGGTDRSKEMSALFDETISRACVDAGWQVKRADTDEHNDPIIDRIITDIRKAPFVVADLRNNNQGVYYEAGFAQGLGREVIFCCPKRTEGPFRCDGNQPSRV
ncbi:MAG: hypothetical protein PVI86_10495 [Phycisphaerae bacterium]|jgi:hypothetical protein